jgi:hypothetical protein
MIDRDLQLMLPENEFVRFCTLDFFKSSGAGGQHRNKTSSAVRVTHKETGISAEDCTERSQHRNRSNAIWKLKILLALQIRQPVTSTLPRMECSLSAPDYPLFIAKLFDILEECGFDHKICAEKCGISSSALLKKLSRDPKIFQEFNRRRELLDLPKLKV